MGTYELKSLETSSKSRLEVFGKVAAPLEIPGGLRSTLFWGKQGKSGWPFLQACPPLHSSRGVFLCPFILSREDAPCSVHDKQNRPWRWEALGRFSRGSLHLLAVVHGQATLPL